MWLMLAAICLAPAVCAAQETPAPVPPTAVPGPVGVPAAPGQFPRYPASLTPTLTVGEEYNDNIFSDNRNRQSDFITTFTPGLTLAFESAVYRFLLSGSVSALVYADHSELNDAAMGRASLLASGDYRLSPRATAALTNTYTKSESSNTASLEGISTGRRSSQSNTITPSYSYNLTQLTTMRLIASYALERFSGGGTADSDVYRIEANADHRFSPRLTGTAGYQFAYLDLSAQPNVKTHTPKIGATYLFSPTLTASVSAGPQFVDTNGTTSVNAFEHADVSQAFSFGSATASYDHSTTTAGGLGGTSETDTVAGGFFVNRWIRNLTLGVTPRYTYARLGAAGGTTSNGTVKSFSVGLSSGYQLLSWMGVLVQYNLFHQRASSRSGAGDVDQNRIFVGLQFGAPINLGPYLPGH